MRLTDKQVQFQEQVYNLLLESIDLPKVGKLLIQHGTEYAHRLLTLNHIRPACYIPTLGKEGKWVFYHEDLTCRAIEAFWKSIDEETEKKG